MSDLPNPVNLETYDREINLTREDTARIICRGFTIYIDQGEVTYVRTVEGADEYSGGAVVTTVAYNDDTGIGGEYGHGLDGETSSELPFTTAGSVALVVDVDEGSYDVDDDEDEESDDEDDEDYDDDEEMTDEDAASFADRQAWDASAYDD